MMGRAIIRLLSVFLIVAAVGVVGVFFFSAQARRINELQQTLAGREQEIAQLRSEKADLTQELDELQKARQAADERVAALRTQLSSATTELERSRESLQELQGRAESLAAERDRTAAQLASVTSERDEVLENAQRLEQDKTNLQRSVSRLRERLTWFDRDYRQLLEKLAKKEAEDHETQAVDSPTVETPPLAPSPSASAVRPSASAMAGTVELPPIIVRKDQRGMVMPVRGRVLEVNAQHHFIIVDAGSLDGVRVGMVLDVLRGGARVGRAAVVRVRPRISACEPIRASHAGTVQVGDQVVQSGQ